MIGKLIKKIYKNYGFDLAYISIGFIILLICNNSVDKSGYEIYNLSGYFLGYWLIFLGFAGLVNYRKK